MYMVLQSAPVLCACRPAGRDLLSVDLTGWPPFCDLKVLGLLFDGLADVSAPAAAGCQPPAQPSTRHDGDID